mmetsp:Transcript_24946/g.69943  ORF Transcript_24946/g.69943 Transcript_24946/m.69943 type:complete len:95 (+) Transcript_24946:248-532(+)
MGDDADDAEDASGRGSGATRVPALAFVALAALRARLPEAGRALARPALGAPAALELDGDARSARGDACGGGACSDEDEDFTEASTKPSSASRPW